MRAGAYDFLEKPFSVSHLASVVERALDKRRLVLENRKLREELADRTGLESRLVGRTPAMDLLRRNVTALAATDADVLILGETGSGKEVVAAPSMTKGRARKNPLLRSIAGRLPAEIIESELFGHEKGSFYRRQRPAHRQAGTCAWRHGVP